MHFYLCDVEYIPFFSLFLFFFNGSGGGGGVVKLKGDGVDRWVDMPTSVSVRGSHLNNTFS